MLSPFDFFSGEIRKKEEEEEIEEGPLTEGENEKATKAEERENNKYVKICLYAGKRGVSSALKSHLEHGKSLVLPLLFPSRDQKVVYMLVDTHGIGKGENRIHQYIFLIESPTVLYYTEKIENSSVFKNVFYVYG